MLIKKKYIIKLNQTDTLEITRECFLSNLKTVYSFYNPSKPCDYKPHEFPDYLQQRVGCTAARIHHIFDAHLSWAARLCVTKISHPCRLPNLSCSFEKSSPEVRQNNREPFNLLIPIVIDSITLAFSGYVSHLLITVPIRRRASGQDVAGRDSTPTAPRECYGMMPWGMRPSP